MWSMLEHLSTWYGMSAAGLILAIAFYAYLKVMGMVWKIAIFTALGVGGFFYFRSMIPS